MEKKKILLSTFSNISDHQDKVVVLYEEMMALGYDVYLMLPKSIDVECEISDRTWFVDCPNRPGIAKGTFNIKNLSIILSKVRKAKFDFIFFESLHVWNLPIMVFLGKKAKVFQMIHDVIPHGGDRTAKQVDLMNRAVCKLADKIIICNSKYQGDLCKRYHVDFEKVITMNLWERFPLYKEPKRNGRMLFFGRLNPYKGADNLLKIVEQCPEVHFDVVGKADSLVADIIEKLKGFKNVSIDERFIKDDEIADAFYNSEWVILPYNSATQSGVVVESYKNSKPVISFDVGAISEQVENEKTGFLIKPKDIEGFSRTIKEVLAFSNSQYKQFCENAYAYGFNKFSPHQAALIITKIMT